MTTNTEKSTIIWVLALFMYSSFYIGGHISNGRFIAYASVIILSVVCLISKNMRFKIKYKSFHLYLLSFCLFSLFSSLWAVDSKLAIDKSLDIFWVYVLTMIIALCYQNTNSLDPLLKLIMWIGYAIMIYVFVDHGIGNILELISGKQRISSESINANTLGMMCAYSILINIYYILKEKRIPIYSILSILSLVMLALSSSKKSFVILFVGFFEFILIKNHAERKQIKKILRIMLLVFAVIGLFFAISYLPIFSNISHRFQLLFNYFTGRGSTDNSTMARASLINIGIELFKNKPILGYGMDNAKIFGGQAFNLNYYYLHNNYIELLVDGGVISVLIYYSMFFYYLGSLVKYKDFDDDEYNICLVFFTIIIITDYTLVSYDDRFVFLMSIMIYIKIQMMKKVKLEVKV